MQRAADLGAYGHPNRWIAHAVDRSGILATRRLRKRTIRAGNVDFDRILVLQVWFQTVGQIIENSLAWNWFHTNLQMTKLIKQPLFLLAAAIAALCLIYALGPTQETYEGKLRRCIGMCKESNRFGRLIEPQRASQKNTIADYQCQCY